MHRLVYLLIFLYSISANAQTQKYENVEANIDSAWNMVKQARYDEAIGLAQGTLNNNPKEVLKDDSLTTKVHFTISQAYYLKNQPDTALVWLHKLIWQNRHKKDMFPRAVKTYTWLALLSAQSGRNQDVIKYAEHAINLSKRVKHHYLELVQSYFCLGQSYLRLNKTKLAQASVETGLNICKEAPGCSKQLIHLKMLNILGLIYNKSQNYELALKCYQQGIDLTFQPSSNKHMLNLLPLLYGNIGGVYRALGDYNQSIIYSKKAIDQIGELTSDAIKTDAAVWIERIGSIHLANHSPTKAISFFEQAILMRKGTYEENTIFHAGSYHLLGKAYYELENYEKAINNIEISKNIFEIYSGTNSVETVVHKRDLSSAYKNIGEFKLSEEYLQEVLDIQLNDEGLDLNQMAMTHGSLAQLFEKQKLFDLANNHYQKALTLNKEFYQNRKSYHWGIYRQLGTIHQKMELFALAETYYNLKFRT